MRAEGAHKGDPVAVGEYKNVFKYPSEDECLVRRLGSAVIASWNVLPENVRDKLMAEARAAWDRERSEERRVGKECRSRGCPHH